MEDIINLKIHLYLWCPDDSAIYVPRLRLQDIVVVTGDKILPRQPVPLYTLRHFEVFSKCKVPGMYMLFNLRISW